MFEIKNIDEYEILTLDAVEDYNRKDYNKALKKFLSLEKANPNNIKIHEVLAFTYIHLNKLDKAKEQYKICKELFIKQHPHIKFAERSFEDLVGEAGEKQKAEREYNKIMRARKSEKILASFDIPSKLAILYMSEGKYDKAEKILKDFRKKVFAAMENEKKKEEKVA
jgi:predicted Zn-dependent protease